MLHVGPALKLTIHLNSDTGSAQGFLYEDILAFLAARGISGATVLLGHAGFGAHRRLHLGGAGDVAGEHLPIQIYVIDDVEKVEDILPELMVMVTDGLVEMHSTQIVKNITTAERVLS